MNVYLTALALSDTAMLYSVALPTWARMVLAYDIYSSHVIVCKLALWVMNTAAILSAWLLVAITVQRTASVVWSHRVNAICTRHRSIVIIVVITAVCGLLQSSMAYGFELVKFENGTTERCTFGSTAYQGFYTRVWIRVKSVPLLCPSLCVSHRQQCDPGVETNRCYEGSQGKVLQQCYLTLEKGGNRQKCAID